MYSNKNTIIFKDGNFVKAQQETANYFTQSQHYGYAAFEGMRAYSTDQGTRIFKAKRHFERLLHSAKILHLDIPYTVDQLIKFSYTLLEKNNFKDAYIRPLLMGGEQMALLPSTQPSLIICCWKWGKYFKEKKLRLMHSNYKRPHPQSFHLDAKISGHYVNGILATNEAQKNGYDEALLCDHNGFIAQAASANIFFEKDSKLYTPKASNILPGITRSVAMKLAEYMPVPVEEGDFTPEDLANADGAFLTGTAVEVIPIESINGKTFKLDVDETLGAALAIKYHRVVTRKDGHSITYF